MEDEEHVLLAVTRNWPRRSTKPIAYVSIDRKNVPLLRDMCSLHDIDLQPTVHEYADDVDIYITPLDDANRLMAYMTACNWKRATVLIRRDGHLKLVRQLGLYTVVGQ